MMISSALFRTVVSGAVLAPIAIAFVGSKAMAQTQQTPPVAPQPSAFSRLFTKYTGQNGYEDLVVAGDLAHDNALATAAEQTTATLKEMRKALEDPNIDRALKLVRVGLDKPIESPRASARLDENTILPEYPEFRELARLIAVEEHVALADGQVSRAIDAMRDGLRLGYIVQNETLIGGLVGISIDAIVLEKIATHFDQMALRDCAHVITIAQEWLKLPNRMEPVVTMEHQTLRNMLTDWKSDPERLRNIVKMMQPKDQPTSESDIAAIELSNYVNGANPTIPALIDEAGAIADREDALLLAEMRKPTWQRKQPNPAELRSSMAHRLYGLVSPTYSQALGRFDTEAAKIHLLGVHGAVRKFRWENNRLPTSLAELKLPSLTTDPFTGVPLVYKVTGDRYELNSTGQTSNASGSGNTGPIFLPKNSN